MPVLHGYVPINRNEAVRAEIKRLGGAEPAACPAAEKADAEEILAFSSPILMAPTPTSTMSSGPSRRSRGTAA